MARTLAEAQEEYTAVRAAYLKALSAESYSISQAGGSRALSRSRTESLRKQMDQLAEEIARFQGSGLKVVAVTPIG